MVSRLFARPALASITERRDARLADACELVLALLWLLAIARLMIADVWDETNGIVIFHDPTRSVWETIHLVWVQSLGFWRPLPTFLAAVALRLLDRDLSWQLLRWCNVVFILGGVAFLRATLRLWLPGEPWRRVLLTFLVLYSGGGIIVATWYANIYDASTFLLLSAGLWLLASRQPVAAGLVFGVAFFCKETTALILPFLVVIVSVQRITWRDAVRTGVPASLFGAVYFFLRARRIPFASSADVHQFRLAELWTTTTGLAQSFWRETMKGHSFSYLGLAVLLISLFAIRNWWGRIAFVLFFLATDVVYWGMFVQYQSGQILNHLDFIGRLYFIPCSFMLLVLLLDSPAAILAVVAITMLIGGQETYRDHTRFQRAYARLYAVAKAAPHKPVRVFLPEKPLDDSQRGIVVGGDATSPWRLNVKTGRLEAN